MPVLTELQEQYLSDAYKIIGEEFSPSIDSVSFRFENNKGNNVATIKEWSSVTSYVNHLVVCGELLEKKQLNKQDLESILNAFRPILFNKNDSIYYGKIFTIQDQMFNGRHYTGTIIKALDGKTYEDKTEIFKEDIKKVKKVIRKLIEDSDLDFIYNGFLQHTDERYAESYIEHIKKKDFELIELKNVVIISYIYELLKRFTYPLRMFIVS